MEENSTAKAMKIIGIIEIASGILLFFTSLENSFTTAAIWLFAGLISGIMFFGFGEIINLLHQSVYKQDKILSKMDNQSSNTKDSKKSVLQDIESNLPIL